MMVHGDLAWSKEKECSRSAIKAFILDNSSMEKNMALGLKTFNQEIGIKDIFKTMLSMAKVHFRDIQGYIAGGMELNTRALLWMMNSMDKANGYLPKEISTMEILQTVKRKVGVCILGEQEGNMKDSLRMDRESILEWQSIVHNLINAIVLLCKNLSHQKGIKFILTTDDI